MNKHVHPAEDAFDVRNDTPVFKTARTSEETTSWDERLNTVEGNIQTIALALMELAEVINGHTAVLSKLIEMPDDIREGFRIITEAQSKVNLAVALKLDMHKELITEVQETVEDLREEVAELDDIPYDEDNIFNDEEDDFLISVDESVLYIPLPARPDLTSEESIKNFDEVLKTIVGEVWELGLIEDVDRESLVKFIENTITAAEANENLNRAPLPHIESGLASWWQSGEGAVIPVSLEGDVARALIQIVLNASGAIAIGAIFAHIESVFTA